MDVVKALNPAVLREKQRLKHWRFLEKSLKAMIAECCAMTVTGSLWNGLAIIQLRGVLNQKYNRGSLAITLMESDRNILMHAFLKAY